MGGTYAIGGLTIEWLGHSSVGVYGKKTIYIDLFGEVLKGNESKADLIISTHGHRDHYDVAAVNQLSHETTKVVIKSGCDRKGLKPREVTELDVPGTCVVDGVEIRAVPAFNVKRVRGPGIPFHPEGFGMGIVATVEGVKLYYAGDTEFIPPMKNLKEERIDVAFLPIGGTYTMDADEAVEAVMAIEPRIIIPVHYNHNKDTTADAAEFKRKVEEKSSARVVAL
jgi:L-ascorbate metabolism protein UlaG (beta-lactamase superfamily)